MILLNRPHFVAALLQRGAASHGGFASPVCCVEVKHLDVPVCVVDPVHQCEIVGDVDLHQPAGFVSFSGVGASSWISVDGLDRTAQPATVTSG